MKQILLTVAFLLSMVIGFGQCPTNGNIELETQQDVDDFAINFPNCTELPNSLLIGDLGGSPGNITNLNGLSQITAIGTNGGGGLQVENIPLESFSGLDNLESIGGRLFIIETGIVNLEGLGSLKTVGDGFTFQNNPNLINFNGIRPDLDLQQSFFIFINQNLINFEGLSLINQEANTNLRITIANNPSLISLEGLEDTRAGERIRLINNNVLQDISQLSNMNISVPDAILELVDNNNLSDCDIETVCQAINDPLVTSTIENNNGGCNSIPQVSEQCLLANETFKNRIAVSILPNPVSETLSISMSGGANFVKAEVYSVSGQKLKETSALQIDMSDLSAGIYFVKVFSEKGTATRKIVKQ